MSITHPTSVTGEAGGAEPSGLSAFGLYTRFVVVATIFLIFVGALVTTKGAGLAVPDWPLSFGKLNPKMVGGVFYEHGHRMVASAVGFFTLVMAFWGQFSPQTTTVRRLSWLALGLVIVQGLLGGLTVLMQLPRPVSIAHGCVAQLFLCTLVAVALYTTPSFCKARLSLLGERGLALRLSGFLAFAAVLLQLLIAATMRHMGAGLVIGDFPTSLGRIIPPFDSAEIVINFTHRVMAVVVLLLIGLFASKIYRERQRLPGPLQSLAAFMVALVLWQICLGAAAVWSARGVIPTSWHVVNGAMVLSTTFATWMWVMRVSRFAAPAAEDVVADQAQAGLTPAPSMLRDLAELFKVKLVAMSALTAALSFWAGRGMLDGVDLIHVTLGVCLIGAGAGALNELLEIEVDRKMARTRQRPLPAGRMSPEVAEFWGCALSVLGVLYLGLRMHPLAGLLAALAVVLYAFVYTPLKRLSPYCTLVGAVPGALPVLVGWSAATGGLEIQGWVLFLILFLWQLPHFAAIAWLCKDDYAQAGLPMSTVIDPSGRMAAADAVGYSLALIPVSLAPVLCGLGGPLYLCFALLLGLAYLYAGIHWSQQRNRPRARRLLLASVVYLPLLFGGMVLW